jgi:hypothetical protein
MSGERARSRDARARLAIRNPRSMRVTLLAFSLAFGATPALRAQAADPGPPPAAQVLPSQIAAALAPLEQLHAIRAVRFVMDVPFAEHAVAWSPDTLSRQGCRYATDDPDRLAALAELLRDAHLQPAPAGHVSRELRQLLDIDFADGMALSFRFGEVFPVDDVVNGQADGLAITARKSSQLALFRWARSLPMKPQRCRAYLDGLL